MENKNVWYDDDGSITEALVNDLLGKERFIESCMKDVTDKHKSIYRNDITRLISGNHFGVRIKRTNYWMNDLGYLSDKIESFKSLERNWDSYGAEPIRGKTIEVAHEVAKKIYKISQNIHVFTMRDGGIQFESSTFGNEAEVIIEPVGKKKMILFDKEYNVAIQVLNIGRLRKFLNTPKCERQYCQTVCYAFGPGTNKISLK